MDGAWASSLLFKAYIKTLQKMCTHRFYRTYPHETVSHRSTYSESYAESPSISKVKADNTTTILLIRFTGMRTENHNCAAKLPVELDYLIIDHLADDKTSLKSCSLVCHAWTAVAHSHLFRSVNVHSTASEARFSAFITSLKMYPDIRAHIQDLTLGCDLAGSFDNKRAEIVNVLTIHSVVSLLPKLRYLTLAGVSLQPQPLNSPSFSLASLPHLCSLHIKGCHFHDEDMTLALDVVRMFVAVGELSFGGFWSMEHARSSSVTQSSQTAIQHLHYDNLGAGPTKMLFESLQTSRVRGAALESLHLTWSSWTEVHEYQAVMGDATSSLKRLELEPTDQFWERGAPSAYGVLNYSSNCLIICFAHRRRDSMAQARLEQTHAPRIFVSALALQPPELPDGRAPALLRCARRVYSYPRTISTAFPPPSDAADTPLSQRGRRGRDRAWNALEPHRRSYFSDAHISFRHSGDLPIGFADEGLRGYAITWLSARPGADVCEGNTKCPVSGT